MGEFLWAIITLGIILFVNWGAATLFHSNFMDWLFMAGLVVTCSIWFFNSSGGFTSDLADARLQSGNNDDNWAATEVKTKIDRQKLNFQPTTAFYVAVGYTVVAGIISLIYFKDFFIN